MKIFLILFVCLENINYYWSLQIRFYSILKQQTEKMRTRFLYVILICAIGSLNCYSQSKYNMRIWTKEGIMYQYPVDIVDSIDFCQKSDFKNWQEIMKFPSIVEIEKYNNFCTERSPYLEAWFDTEDSFTQFSIDFKADYVPSATYCSPVNFHIDYSSLLEKYDTIDNGRYISGYGGLQRQIDGTKFNSILSLWDVYCKKKSGGTDTIRASLFKPVGAESVIFNHEGNGVSYRPSYPWEPRKWYRMLIQLGISETTGNTTLTQWLGDITEKKWHQLCVFDLGAPGLKFKNKTAVFLENFDPIDPKDPRPRTAGEIRTLEFKNVKVYSNNKQRWISIYSAYFCNDEGDSTKKSGSYQYGADYDTFWMITTGVPDCASPQAPASLEVHKSEIGSPLDL